MRELGDASFDAYRERLERDPDELALVATFCRVTISRFYRDRALWDRLRRADLPRLARAGRSVRAWSAGCASGEEPYTLRLIWDLEVSSEGAPPLEVLATDAGEQVLERARSALYDKNSMKELPAELRDRAFVFEAPVYRLTEALRAGVTFLRRDLRDDMPPGPFDLVFCRNLAFSYFDDDAQRETARRFAERMPPGALLVLGSHERLPFGAPFVLDDPSLEVYRRT